MKVQPCRAKHSQVTLRSGRSLALALAEALDGIDSAWLELTDVPGDLRFVLPDHANDAHHAAWYSAEHRVADGLIHRAGMIWGRREGHGFAHIHGQWSGTMGHLLADTTFLADDCQANVTVLSGARFDASEDAETGFLLFQPVATTPIDDPNSALLRLAPDIDLCEGVAHAVADLGWSGAMVLGIGSLNAPCFRDGTALDSHATEFLIRRGLIRRKAAEIDLDIVGIGGTLMSGTLEPGRAPVCVTAELILHRLPGDQ